MPEAMTVKIMAPADAAEDIAKKFAAALHAPDHHTPPAWPLPWMGKTTGNDFWSYQSIVGFKAMAWLGSHLIDEQYASVVAFFADHMDMAGGGFAVAVFRDRTAYFRWSGCSHAWTARRMGRGWHRHQCLTCGASYDVDSSG